MQCNCRQVVQLSMLCLIMHSARFCGADTCSALCCVAEDLLAVRQAVSKQLKQLTGNLKMAIQTMTHSQPLQQQQQHNGAAAAAKCASPPRSARLNVSPRKTSRVHAVVSGGLDIAGGSHGGSSHRDGGGGRQQWQDDDTTYQHDVNAGASAVPAAAAAGARAHGSSGGSGAARLLFGGSNGGGQPQRQQQQQQGHLHGRAGSPGVRRKARGRSTSPAQGVGGSPILARGSASNSGGSGRRTAGAGAGVATNSSSCRGSSDSWHGGVWRPAGLATANKGPLSPMSPAAKAASWGDGLGLRVGSAGRDGGVRGLSSKGVTGGTSRALNDTELDVVLRLLGSMKGQR